MAKEKDVEGYLSAHSLAELYSVLTRLPKPLKVTPDEAHAIITRLLEYLVPVELSAEDYEKAITRLSSLQLSGGVTFDALIAQAAIKIKAERLLTFNAKDFVRLGDNVAKIVSVPK